MYKDLLKQISAVILVEFISVIVFVAMLDSIVILFVSSLLNILTIVFLVLDEEREFLGYEINTDKYNFTLMLWLFLGLFGIHRIKNGKLVTGIYMCVATSIFIVYAIIVVVYSVLFLNVMATIGISAIVLLNFLFIIVCWLPVFMIYYIDMWMILCERFKNTRNKTLYKRSNHILKTWSSYVVVLVGVLFTLVVCVLKVYLS